MNIKNYLTRRSLVAVAFALLLSQFPAAGALADNDLGQSAGAVVVPSGVTASEVQDAIVMALSGRQWGIKAKTDERVVGYLKHRSNEATVTLIYNNSKIDLYCVGWQIDKKTGAREKPEQPKGWLKNLQVDITKNLNRTITNK